MRFAFSRILPVLLVAPVLFLACSSPSSPAAVQKPTVIPPIPSGVLAASSTSQVTISWASVPGATRYHVYRSLTTGVTKTTGFDFFGVSCSFVQTGLANGTTLLLCSDGRKYGGESDVSSQVSATPITTPTLSSPPIQDFMEGNESSPQWNLNWNPVAGASGYHIYYSPSASVTPATGTLISVSGATSFYLQLPVSQTNYFIVTASNTGGESAPSPAVHG